MGVVVVLVLVLVVVGKLGRGCKRKTGGFRRRGDSIGRLELESHGQRGGKRAGHGLVQQGRWRLSDKNHGAAAGAKGGVGAVVLVVLVVRVRVEWRFLLCPGIDARLAAVRVGPPRAVGRLDAVLRREGLLCGSPSGSLRIVFRGIGECAVGVLGGTWAADKKGLAGLVIAQGFLERRQARGATPRRFALSIGAGGDILASRELVPDRRVAVAAVGTRMARDLCRSKLGEFVVGVGVSQHVVELDCRPALFHA